MLVVNGKLDTHGRNPILTPLQPNCRLCHYAGYSNLCTYSEGGTCPYVSLRNSLSTKSED
jgi:hypothetical protein